MKDLGLYEFKTEGNLRHDELVGYFPVDDNRLKMCKAFQPDRYGEYVIYCVETDQYIMSKKIKKDVAYLSSKGMFLSKNNVFKVKSDDPEKFITDENFCDFDKYFEIESSEEYSGGINIRDKYTGWVGQYENMSWNYKIDIANRLAYDIEKSKLRRSFSEYVRLKDVSVSGKYIKAYIAEADKEYKHREITIRNIIEAVNNEDVALYKSSKKYLDGIFSLKGIFIKNIKSQEDFITTLKNEVTGRRQLHERRCV